ncbi:hypothetical protein SAMN04488503_2236 [Humidesulfovibrio mexicanus]|uniref:Phosphoadenosine phosphosulfate reductase family protein n=1 Tax=Humidesulfovibrio mexicanus TaxID=147047 RepID=A0A239AWH0_9BACT|nr:hypothetical protein [Humidesulfovibrio mexicanus]SNR99384.1 hypothetical protein SAMN04488503_2236 [Humidesulfovibrio mexicanus]
MELSEIVKRVRAKSPDGKVLLSFSRGKDAWAAWLAIRDKFDVCPFYYYGIEGLEFVDEYLEYCERVIGKRIVRLPSPAAHSRLSPKGLVFQPPERVETLCACNLETFDWTEVQRTAARCFGIDEGTYTALGVRAADSARRALAFKSHGPVTENLRKFYPVWDWNKDRLVSELTRNNIVLPVDYKIWGRTFDGIYLLFLLGLKKHFPRDYQRVLEYYPLADLELFRYGKETGNFV